MVLPLRIGDNVIGALDLEKAASPNASAAQQAAAIFTSEDADAFQVLADQLAVAIDKTRVVQQLEATVREVDVLYQRQVQQNWLGSTHLVRNVYEYNRVQVNPLATPRIELDRLSAETNAQLRAGRVVTLPPEDFPDAYGETMLVPVVLRDQLIGVIGLEHNTPGQSWPEDAVGIVQATATQAALTLENARLIEETRRRAEREAMIGYVAARVRETLDMETVLKTAIREIGRAMNVDEVEVRMGAGESRAPIPAEPGNGKAHDLAGEVPQ